MPMFFMGIFVSEHFADKKNVSVIRGDMFLLYIYFLPTSNKIKSPC